MSNITLEEIRTELAGFVQDTVDALGYATYGSDYKGKWAAGDYDVETVVSHSLRFYSSLVARTATDTADPSLDTAAWKLLGSAATIRGISQDNVDALGNSTYGSLYKGLWTAGVHAVGEYRSYGGRYYRCKTDRTASNTDSPPMDEAGWEVVGSSFVVQGDIETAKQENIDTAADLVFGSSYRGKWERDSYDPGDVVYDEEGKGFYECDIARTQRNRNPPSVNTSHWSRVDPLNKVVKDSTGLARVKSQAFTSNGTWTKPANVENVRVFLIGAGGGGAGGKRGGTGQATSGYNPSKPFNNAGYGGGSGRSTGGGAAGQFVDAVVPVTDDVAVTIGAGGEGGAANSDGSNGGDTTFGSIIRAHGGGGGKTTGGEGGRGTGGVDVTGAGDGVGFPYGISSRNGGVYDQVNSNFCYGDGGALGSDGAGTNNEPTDSWSARGGSGLGGQRGGSGAGGYGDGGAGGNGGNGGRGGRTSESGGQPGSAGTDGGDAVDNTGAGGGAGGSGGGGGGGRSGNYGQRKNGGAGGMGGAGGRGGSGYAVVFWTE